MSSWKERPQDYNHREASRKRALEWMRKRKEDAALDAKLDALLGPADYIGPEWGLE
jgi:hypothetical protein